VAEVQVNGTPRDGWRRTGDDDTIRAFEADGREAWSVPAGGKVLQLSGDPSGGVVALVADRDGAGSGLRVLGPTGSGGGLIQDVSAVDRAPRWPGRLASRCCRTGRWWCRASSTATTCN
jgi:hypothetical protein